MVLKNATLFTLIIKLDDEIIFTNLSLGSATGFIQTLGEVVEFTLEFRALLLGLWC